ncbi:hypothetical protein EDC01DRAFT_105764 [Geopyxis carbonaria]|nr:hypothetical protein EDC01DRAFT_105764 [Geopyxis carbonaria]
MDSATPVLNIPAVIALAAAAGGGDYTGCTVSEPMPTPTGTGTDYTLTFKSDGTRWTLHTPAPHSGRDLHSEVMSQRQLRLANPSAVPIPHVHGFCASAANPLKTPYILTAAPTGRLVADVWPTASETCRHRILDSIAEAMAQLRAFRCDQLGMLKFLERPGGIGMPKITGIGRFPVSVGGGQVAQIGPFETSEAYYDALVELQPAGERALLRIVLAALPRSIAAAGNERESFVLAPTTFDGGSVWVREDGALEALGGWEGVATVPRTVGHTKCPAWIMGDDGGAYRARYAAALKRLEGEGEGTLDYCSKSHLYAAVVGAAQGKESLKVVLARILAMVPEAEREGERLERALEKLFNPGS